MIIPVRCFSCGKVIGDLYYKFAEEVQKGRDPK
ncbi:MAG: DNA-directed RNA polymerase subunit N, partial [Candidatus Iainarchaeum archaeon]